MSKTSINKKDVREFIIANRLNGKSDQEIYNDLSAKFYDKKTIALMIIGTVTQESKLKYKNLNAILLVLILFTILFKIYFVFGLTLQTDGLWPLFFIFIIPLLNVYFFYEVFRFNAVVYKFIGLLTIASLLKTFSNSIDSNGITNIIEFLISFVIATGIIGLSLYLGNKLLPNYNPKKLIKDSDGEYILK